MGGSVAWFRVKEKFFTFKLLFAILAGESWRSKMVLEARVRLGFGAIDIRIGDGML